MTNIINEKKLRAALPEPNGKPEFSDGTSWYSLATENWVLNTVAMVEPCLVATTANLIANYGSGPDVLNPGVGATLTNGVAPAEFTALVIDGVTLALNDRVLVNNQTTNSQNGIYVVTDIGSTSEAWILTRSTDFDSAAEMVIGTIVNVIQGNTYAVTAWMLTSNVVDVGTDSITFTNFAKASEISISGATNQITVTTTGNNNVIGIASNAVLPGNEGVTIPVGTTGERALSPAAGVIRFNTSL
jgi:hypothetical protein